MVFWSRKSTLSNSVIMICGPVKNFKVTLISVPLFLRRYPWCNGYHRWKWTRRLEFKSWTRMIAFHIALIPMGKGMNPIILSPAMGK